MSIIPVLQHTGGGNHLEQIKDLLRDPAVTQFRGLIAFASLNGLLLLDGDESGAIRSFLERGGAIDWIIGVDAVTTADALRLVRSFAQSYPTQVTAKVYDSPGGQLFHPKLYVFGRQDGSATVLVGSSNLTKGGLIQNTEVSVRADIPVEDVPSWTQLYYDVASTTETVKDITDSLLEEIAKRRQKEAKIAKAASGARSQKAKVAVAEGLPEAAVGSNRVLVQLTPMSGSRPQQLGIEAKTMADFFGLTPGSRKKVQLQQVQPGLPPAGLEQPRPLIFAAGSNKNRKIEVGGLKAVKITAATRPIVVFEELDNARYRYLILQPAEKGYPALKSYLGSLPKGRAMAHQIMSVDDLIAIWPDYPV